MIDILTSRERLKLLEHIHNIRYELGDWVFAEIRLTINARDKNVPSTRELVFMITERFESRDGKLLVCNPTEFLMIINWRDPNISSGLVEEIKDTLPEGICHVDIFPPNKEGLSRIELHLESFAMDGNGYLLTRQMRQENIIMTADDQKIIRKLIHKICDDENIGVVEVEDAAVIVKEYIEHLPDILFLDINFPNLDGIDILREILKVDPDAYVIMLSADSTHERVLTSRDFGAKAFLAKPVTKENVLTHIRKCPTIYSDKRGPKAAGSSDRKAG